MHLCVVILIAINVNEITKIDNDICASQSI
jgi:hypothetical protein